MGNVGPPPGGATKETSGEQGSKASKANQSKASNQVLDIRFSISLFVGDFVPEVEPPEQSPTISLLRADQFALTSRKLGPCSGG